MVKQHSSTEHIFRITKDAASYQVFLHLQIHSVEYAENWQKNAKITTIPSIVQFTLCCFGVLNAW